jgi:hypothetical protein
MADALKIDTLEELCRFVADTLARLENLKAEHLTFTQEVLYRQGAPCGMYFCLYGPRELQLSAVWETDSNTILVYGSCGQRVERTMLLAAPAISA